MMNTYSYPHRFHLESGGFIDGLTIAYHTFGSLSPARDNVLWVCHGLTANSDLTDWWPGALGPDGFIDTSRHFVVCANLLGSHYGTTGPLSVNPATGEPYYDSFPKITIRDMARVNSILAGHLGIKRIDTLIGASVGGFQALEWAVSEPERFGRLVLVATAPEASPWSIALDEAQRMAIRADGTYSERRPDAGRAGMAAARAIGLLSYRGPGGYNLTQRDTPDSSPGRDRRAVSYQQYQGEKLCRRFNAYSYVTILDAFDTHDISRGRGSMAGVLSQVAMPVLIVGIDSDIIFTPPEISGFAAMIPGCEQRQISSPMGHDGFLIETASLARIIKPFIYE